MSGSVEKNDNRKQSQDPSVELSAGDFSRGFTTWAIPSVNSLNSFICWGNNREPVITGLIASPASAFFTKSSQMLIYKNYIGHLQEIYSTFFLIIYKNYRSS